MGDLVGELVRSRLTRRHTSPDEGDDARMRRAIGVTAILAVVTITAAVLDEDLVLSGNGCPVGTDRWATVAVDLAGDEAGFETKADAVRAWFREGTLEASDPSIVRAIARSERESDGHDPIMVRTSEGLPAVLSLEIVNAGWLVTDADWCRRRAER